MPNPATPAAQDTPSFDIPGEELLLQDIVNGALAWACGSRAHASCVGRSSTRCDRAAAWRRRARCRARSANAAQVLSRLPSRRARETPAAHTPIRSSPHYVCVILSHSLCHTQRMLATQQTLVGAELCETRWYGSHGGASQVNACGLRERENLDPHIRS